MANPAISIVISTHNGAQTLPRALESIARQLFSNYEVITIDDASTDRTASILKHWQEVLPLRILTNPSNLGLTKSLNRGIAQSASPLVARLDDDDWWEPDKLTQQLQFLYAHPTVGLLGCQYRNYLTDGSETTSRLPLSDRAIRDYIFRRNPFGHSCVVFQKRLWQKVGGYDETLRYGQDLDLWFRLLPVTQLANLPETLCHRRLKPHSSRRRQAITHLTTTAKYIHRYKAAPLNYVYLLESVIVAALRP